MELNSQNEKERISHHYKEVREIISRSLQETNLSFSSNDEEENKFFSEIKKTLAEEDETFKQEIDELKKISDWENFCISFFGETNAGKSTIIETLRIIYDEESRRKRIERNTVGLKAFLRKLLLKMGFKAGTESRLGRFLKSDGNVVDGQIIGTGRSDFTKVTELSALDQNLQAFYHYIQKGAVESDLTEEISHKIRTLKIDSTERRLYMTLALKMAELENDAYDKGYGKGYDSGYGEGVSIGLERGVSQSRLETAKTMLCKGIDVAVVAECTQLPIETVRGLAGVS